MKNFDHIPLSDRTATWPALLSPSVFPFYVQTYFPSTGQVTPRLPAQRTDRQHWKFSLGRALVCLHALADSLLLVDFLRIFLAFKSHDSMQGPKTMLKFHSFDAKYGSGHLKRISGQNKGKSKKHQIFTSMKNFPRWDKPYITCSSSYLGPSVCSCHSMGYLPP